MIAMTSKGLDRSKSPMMTSAMRQMIHNRVLKNVMSAGKTRQNPTKKRSLCVINEHFEEDFNAALSSAIFFNSLLECILLIKHLSQFKSYLVPIHGVTSRL
jgi:hypothetical protein